MPLAMLRFLAALALLLLASPVSGGLAPVGVVDGVLVVPYGADDVLVAWSPGPEGATYRVYGDAGSLDLLAVTTDVQAVVAAGYAVYVVESVVDGQVVSVRSSGLVCVGIMHGTPPRPYVYDCWRVLHVHRPA